jgi:hypothetical protein
MNFSADFKTILAMPKKYALSDLKNTGIKRKRKMAG